MKQSINTGRLLRRRADAALQQVCCRQMARKKMRLKEELGPFIISRSFLPRHPCRSGCSRGCLSLQTSALAQHLHAAAFSFKEASELPTDRQTDIRLFNQR